jgi:hypothetical protein
MSEGTSVQAVSSRLDRVRTKPDATLPYTVAGISGTRVRSTGPEADFEKPGTQVVVVNAEGLAVLFIANAGIDVGRQHQGDPEAEQGRGEKHCAE